MIANHIHHALAQVEELRRRILERQRFKGYSGRARAIGGSVALAGAAVMARGGFPRAAEAHVIGWGTVFAVAVLANYGALAWWFLFDPEVRRDLQRLRPAVDILPSLLVGGILSLVFILHGRHEYLFGTWMALFGLANLASRHVLPRLIWPVGLFYILCGAACLLIPGISFTNPWPMGIIFFIGEWAGGIVLHFHR
ncbi:MAG: hypothetical protein V1809_07650 [Planctomycetota bacterium]